ncbi:putative aminotransferase [Gordonia effusa NBRC 100432]|uniref:Putative aminotransferase n=1 Tax=Gordonia effusa NBRC 100432 TaxID=1077974 RepID=H0R0L7_9ACTN|nr:aminotransferase class I/II-fold pyridoxal phosphate-dependent enzyme [Gordonia effusa]GAB18618.1 putative aminotransferase [Gordonia effusa NBRC 100432]
MTSGIVEHRTEPVDHLLALNEIPFGPLPSVRLALSEALGRVNRYPEFFPSRLADIISGHIGTTQDQIVVGPGLTGILTHLLREFVSAGDNVVMSVPTFDGYPILTEMAGGICHAVALTGSGEHNLAAMADAVDHRTRLVVVCSPHNPTGTCVDPAELAEFLTYIDPTIPVILDEAYVEFADPAHRTDPLALVAMFPNVLVLRTFSKAYGLAALRIGYGIGSPTMIERIRRRLIPFEMNALAEVAVAACYRAEPELLERITPIIVERDRLSTRLRHLGFDVAASAANFVHVSYRSPSDSIAVLDAFNRARIAVKDCTSGVRITVADCHSSGAVVGALSDTIT